MKVSVRRLDKLIWPLIYGGFFLLAIGIALSRNDDSLGAPIIVAGALATLVGVVLVWVRSRLPDPPAP